MSNLSCYRYERLKLRQKAINVIFFLQFKIHQFKKHQLLNGRVMILIINRYNREKNFDELFWICRKVKFANIIRSCRLSRALVPAKGALWRDEISCVLVNHPKFEELYLRIYCTYVYKSYINTSPQWKM